MISEQRVSNFTGLSLLKDYHEIGLSAMLRAKNVYVDTSGAVKSRPGYQKVSSDMYIAASGPLALTTTENLQFIRGGAPSDLGAFPGSALSTVEDNGLVYVSSEATIGVYSAERGLQTFDVVPPNVIVTSSTGGLVSGRYGVVVVGKGTNDLPSNPIRFVDPGGIYVSTDRAVDIFITAPNGSEYFFHRTLESGSVTISDSDYSTSLGRPLTHLFYQPLPPGDILAMVMGCLVSAIGTEMRISEPLEHGIFDPVSGYLVFPDPITAVLPIGNTVFIGTETEVYVAMGNSPKTWVLNQISGQGVVRKSGLLTTVIMPGENRYQVVAVFTQKDGAVVVGTGDGTLYNLTYSLVGDPPGKINGAYALDDYIYLTY